MNNDLSLFLSRYLFTPLMQDSSDNTPHSAAVLVPIINRPLRPTLLFTQRSYHLRHHPGQVAFPGGKRDETDHSLYETALRETYEEVGIPAHLIQLVGELPTVNSRTGHSVKPFLALVQPNFSLNPNSDEVAEVFEVPLEYLMQPTHYVTLPLGQRQVHFLPYGPHLIWGMTANILLHLNASLSPF
ncbi:CoA pyrophosphatase [Tatumella ptyseos]|uniref:CoA pyrophosphatase n=1 Tax=Tatumella ptyseos TaxID=82987 RepID=UPI0026F15A5B|nr:CoA pyrophosphatase [Tatumella ptyseos]WKX25311.1 CoA pyrophosphatase [Tatumella ptyseos]